MLCMLPQFERFCMLCMLCIGLTPGCLTCTEGAGSFAWKPRIADAVQSWNLPRSVCQPLKHMSDVTKGPALIDLASAHGEEAEEMILQYPDLQVLQCTTRGLRCSAIPLISCNCC